MLFDKYCVWKELLWPIISYEKSVLNQFWLLLDTKLPTVCKKRQFLAQFVFEKSILDLHLFWRDYGWPFLCLKSSCLTRNGYDNTVIVEIGIWLTVPSQYCSSKVRDWPIWGTKRLLILHLYFKWKDRAEPILVFMGQWFTIFVQRKKIFCQYCFRKIRFRPMLGMKKQDWSTLDI